MAVEFIKIVSADGKQHKTVEKSALSIYAVRGWKEDKGITAPNTASTGYPTYGSTTKAQ